jgi:hypothetical protein
MNDGSSNCTRRHIVPAGIHVIVSRIIVTIVLD